MRQIYEELFLFWKGRWIVTASVWKNRKQAPGVVLNPAYRDANTWPPSKRIVYSAWDGMWVRNIVIYSAAFRRSTMMKHGPNAVWRQREMTLERKLTIISFGLSVYRLQIAQLVKYLVTINDGALVGTGTGRNMPSHVLKYTFRFLFMSQRVALYSSTYLQNALWIVNFTVNLQKQLRS